MTLQVADNLRLVVADLLAAELAAETPECRLKHTVGGPRPFGAQSLGVLGAHVFGHACAHMRAERADGARIAGPVVPLGAPTGF